MLSCTAHILRIAPDGTETEISQINFIAKTLPTAKAKASHIANATCFLHNRKGWTGYTPTADTGTDFHGRDCLWKPWAGPPPFTENGKLVHYFYKDGHPFHHNARDIHSPQYTPRVKLFTTEHATG